MIESGVIRYGKEFEKSLHEGGWDVSKVDMEELSKSQATLVFGQMNEPQAHVHELPSQDSQLQSTSVMEMKEMLEDETSCSS